jgi:cell division initiation protein
MRVTPLDIIKKEFTPSRRGVDEIEVQNFLEDVRETLDELLKENQRLREIIKRRDAEIDELKGEESSIKDTLVLARRLTEDLERQSRRESDLIIGEAQLEAQRILMSIADERRNLQAEITKLRTMKVRMVAEVQAVLSAHSQLLSDMTEEDTSNEN